MTDRAVLRSKVFDVITDHLKRPRFSITDATVLIDDLGADSLDAVEITFDLEDAFDIDISDADCEHLSTCGHFADLVERLLQAKADA